MNNKQKKTTMNKLIPRENKINRANSMETQMEVLFLLAYNFIPSIYRATTTNFHAKISLPADAVDVIWDRIKKLLFDIWERMSNPWLIEMDRGLPLLMLKGKVVSVHLIFQTYSSGTDTNFPIKFRKGKNQINILP